MNNAGAAPLTKTVIEARADANWWQTGPSATGPWALLSKFC